MLSWIGRTGGVEGGGKHRMAGHMMPPVIEGYSPRIGVWVAAEGGQSVGCRPEAKPARVLDANRTVGGFNLRIEKDGISEQEVAIRSPDKIV